VIAVRVRDHRPRHGTPRVDVEGSGFAVQALIGFNQHRWTTKKRKTKNEKLKTKNETKKRTPDAVAGRAVDLE
jgi:hypothetical protein